ncbi:MAG: hypothetical protein IT440_10495 [Phycisphaeraceae bacterium]|nr:hypothetical protein [Phycisphaeraceae bacterium]
MLLAALGVGGVLLSAMPAQACPNCKELIADNSGPGATGVPGAMDAAGGGNLGLGFFWSIVLMMSAPFVMAGGFGAFLWMHARPSSEELV